MSIHPTAVIDPSATLEEGVEVGAFAYVGPQVHLGKNVVVDHHASVESLTTVGEGTKIWSYAAVGGAPQDLKFKGEPSTLEIGKNCMIREFTTLNRGTEGGGGITRLGDNCLIMAYSHVAHDCILGNNIIMANCSTLAGHVTLLDNCSLGGLVAVHQFTRVGSYCYVGGGSMVNLDQAPYTMVEGNRAAPRGLNLVGLKRAGFSPEAIDALKKAYKIIFRTRTPIKKAVEQVRKEVPLLPEVENLLDFINTTERGVARQS